jgi:subfamily B ATP-binding cassette protein MsbA
LAAIINLAVNTQTKENARKISPYSAYGMVGRIYRGYLHRHIGKIIIAVLCMIMVAATTAAHAWLLQPALDEIFVKKDQQMLILIPIAVGIIALVKAIATYFQAVIMRNMGQRLVCDLQMDLFSHLIHSDLASLNSQGSGRIISRFTNDIGLLRNASANLLTGVAKELLTLIALVGVMFYQSTNLAIIAFVAFPLAINPLLRAGKRMRKISGQTQHELGNFTSGLDDVFLGIRVIKAYAAEKYEEIRTRSTIEKLYGLYVKASRVQGVVSPLMEMLGGMAIAAVVWYGGVQVLEGETTPGAFFSFLAAMVMAYRPAKVLAGLVTNLQEGLAAAERLFKLMDERPQISQKPDARPLTVSSGEIAIHDVSFTYNGDAEVIKNVDIRIPAGKKVALVGPSGSGKSTLFNLLLRFYDPSSGNITIDGQNISEVTLESLRNNIGVVIQESFLFDDTVKANIAYGNSDASMEDIMKAAELAEAHEFISKLEDGYETQIGQNGNKLSGGQKQRIAIARAILKNAPILLLDEATSSLDTVSEKLIQSALSRLMKGRTTLVIAHRLSTIEDADYIYVLKNGSIVEFGSHDELVGKKSLYAELYAA